MKKAYIIGLRFGTWQSEVWFSGNDNAETEALWNKTVKGLTAVGNHCSNPNEFLTAAVASFEENGFVRIQR